MSVFIAWVIIIVIKIISSVTFIACHPSCSTCHGFTENDCYTCPHGRKLKYGKCDPVCPEGKYSDLNGLCTGNILCLRGKSLSKNVFKNPFNRKSFYHC